MKESNNTSQDQVNLESLMNKEEETQSLQEIIAPYLMRWKWFVIVKAKIADLNGATWVLKQHPGGWVL